VHWNLIGEHQNLSKEFREKYKDRF